MPNPRRDWLTIIVIVLEIAIGLAATAGVYAAFHFY